MLKRLFVVLWVIVAAWGAFVGYMASFESDAFEAFAIFFWLPFTALAALTYIARPFR